MIKSETVWDLILVFICGVRVSGLRELLGTHCLFCSGPGGHVFQLCILQLPCYFVDVVLSMFSLYNFFHALIDK